MYPVPSVAWGTAFCWLQRSPGRFLQRALGRFWSSRYFLLCLKTNILIDSFKTTFSSPPAPIPLSKKNMRKAKALTASGGTAYVLWLVIRKFMVSAKKCTALHSPNARHSSKQNTLMREIGPNGSQLASLISSGYTNGNKTIAQHGGSKKWVPSGHGSGILLDPCVTCIDPYILWM